MEELEESKRVCVEHTVLPLALISGRGSTLKLDVAAAVQLLTPVTVT